MKKQLLKITRITAVWMLLLALLMTVTSCGGMEEAPKEVLQSAAEATEETLQSTPEEAVEETGQNIAEEAPEETLQSIAEETPAEAPEETLPGSGEGEEEIPSEGILETPMDPEQPGEQDDLPGSGEDVPFVREDGEYTSKDEVAAYIHEFGHLPSNYITKKKAEELGWVAREGNLWKVAPGKSIGGGRFGNYEGLLPEKNGRKYYECDIDFRGKSRGAKRIVYSNDGLIFYTEDHYETFEQLYG